MTSKKHDHCPACGFVFDETQPRSPKQHRAFFHMVWLALNQWPEAHAFQPSGATHKDRFEHLRAYLLCEAKYRDVRGERMNLETQMTRDDIMLFAAALQVTSRSKYCFLREHRGMLYIVEPKSIAEISHEDFQPVFDEVLHLIQQHTGIDIKFIKQELRQFQ